MAPRAVRVLRGERLTPVPIWLMRQAGRYLPEYRDVREKAGGFMEMALDSGIATEITLQPIRRFDADVAIIFADILLIPHALGRNLRFTEGHGPVLDALSEEGADGLPGEVDHRLLHPVYETVGAVRAALPEDKAVFGFAGAPWTVAAYMIAGGSEGDFLTARVWGRKHPERMKALLDRLADETAHYLIAQAQAGADAVQIFESHAGFVPHDLFADWVIAPTRRIIDQVKAAKPDLPIIGFPRACGFHYGAYAAGTGVDAVGVDHQSPPAAILAQTPEGMALQGALDPAILQSDRDGVRKAAAAMLGAFKERPHIFNLGHGVDRRTPPDNVAALFEAVREWRG